MTAEDTRARPGSRGEGGPVTSTSTASATATVDKEVTPAPRLPAPAVTRPGSARSAWQAARAAWAASGAGAPPRTWRSRLTRRRVLVGAIALVAVVVVLAAVLGSVGGGGSGGFATSNVAPERAAGGIAAGVPPLAADDKAGSGESAGAAADAAAPAATAPAAGTPDSGAARPAGVTPRIVWTGSMSVEVAAGAVDGTIEKISGAAAGLGGYLSGTEVAGTSTPDDDVPQTATVTARVPSASFDKLRDAVGGQGTVTSSATNSQDVTAQYVDLEARESAAKASRTTYLALLAKATTVGEILSVQQQIDGIQSQIEQLEGQRKVLADQSDLATLTINLAEVGARALATSEENGFLRALRHARDGFLDGLESIISALGTLAVIVVVVAVLYGLYRLARLARRRGRATGGGPAPASGGGPPASGGGGA